VRLYNESLTTTIGYTPNGLRQSVVDSLGTTSYEYDNRDRLTRYNQPIYYTGAATMFYSRVGYEYDPAGNRTMVKYIGHGGATREQTAYEYDKAHRLRKALVPDDITKPTTTFTATTMYSYNALGLRTEQSLPVATGIKISYNYDVAQPDRLTNITHTKNTVNVLSSYEYTFNPTAAGKAGLRTGLIEKKNNGAQTATYAWTYDAAYLLLSEQRVGSSTIITGFEYDKAGNRSRMTTGSGQATLATYEYDKLDRLLLLKNATGAISEEYGYDRRGNLAQIRASGSVTRTF
jgi:YD repeat-containing protein